MSAVGLFDSIISGFATGLAGSITVVAKTWNGTALSAPGGTTIGTVVEGAMPGTYYCRVNYGAALAQGVSPVVQWTVSGTTVEDYQPTSVSTIDPLAFAVPGSYAAGTAGYVLQRLDAAVSSRVPTSSLPANFASLAIDFATGGVTVHANADKTGYSLTQSFPANFPALQISVGGNVTIGGYASGQDPATLVLDVAQSAHNGAGSVGHAIGLAGGGDPLLAVVPGTYAVGTAGHALGNLDAPVSGVPMAVAKFDLSTVTGESVFSVINALRGGRNRVAVNLAGTQATVYKEDGTTVAFTLAITSTPGASPITGVTPQ